jgi:hypothetical protein
MHQADIGLNLPFALMMPEPPLPAALTQHLPVNSLNSSVYIYEEDRKAQAFVQARPRPRRDEWEVLTLGVVGDVQPEAVENLKPEDGEETELTHPVENQPASNDGAMLTAQAVEIKAAQQPEDGETEPETEQFGYISAWPQEIEMAWLRLLEHLVVDAGEKGVVRVYARISSDSPQLDLFNQTGFHAYTHENLFYLSYEQAVERPAALPIREQRNRDAWNIQQLYTAITPTFVQSSEQSNSRSWEIHKGYLPRPTKETGWILTEGEKAMAYIRILSHRNRHLIRFMNLDTRRELLPDLVRFALATLKAGADTQVYCTVREYQMEQEAVLEDFGFSRIHGKQAVLVKHTVQFVRATERQLARSREGKLVIQAHSAVRPNLWTKVIEFLRHRLVVL